MRPTTLASRLDARHESVHETSTVSLHATPTLRKVVREQINIVARSLVLEARVVAVVVAIVSVVIAIEIVNGRAGSWFDSGEWSLIGLVSLVYPFAVWRRDRRFAPSFLWTLPVNRTQLVYAKVFAGWVWLMAALAAFIAWKFALSLLSGLENARIMSLDSAIGATALYLIGSGVLLALRQPLRWFLGAAAVLIMLGLLERGLAAGPFASRPSSRHRACSRPWNSSEAPGGSSRSSRSHCSRSC